MSEGADPALSVAGKTAVVIGGTSGIGEAIALGFAADGADVVASSRSEDRVADTAAKVRDRGAATVEATCDVTDRDSLRALRDEVLDAFGTVDVLVTSAAAISREPLVDVSESEWTDVIDVQLNGVYRSMQLFAREMSSGSIVNISSIVPQVAAPNLSAYAAAKGGVDALTRAAARELAPAIRVNAVAPGFVITPHNRDTYAEDTERRRRVEERASLGRVAEREEIVGAVAYLASDAASYTTGEVLTVDGGVAKGMF